MKEKFIALVFHNKIYDVTEVYSMNIWMKSLLSVFGVIEMKKYKWICDFIQNVMHVYCIYSVKYSKVTLSEYLSYQQKNPETELYLEPWLENWLHSCSIYFNG